MQSGSLCCRANKVESEFFLLDGAEAAIKTEITIERRNIMKSLTYIVSMITVLVVVFVAPAFAAGTREGGYSPAMQSKIEEMKKELKKYTDDQATVEKNLKTFDKLDFVVFSNQEWTRLHESHSKDVKVNWPDGHYTKKV